MDRSTDFAGIAALTPAPKYKQCSFDATPFTFAKVEILYSNSLNILASPFIDNLQEDFAPAFAVGGIMPLVRRCRRVVTDLGL